MKLKEKEKKLAVQLRRKGLSYREIARKVPVSKATLSLWLREIELTKEHKERLVSLFEKGRRMGADARRQQRLNKLEVLRTETNQELPTLLRDQFFTLGLALYWAEGSKQKPWHLNVRVKFSNSDPASILLMRKWFAKYLSRQLEDFTYRLYIHETADINRAQKKWADILNIPVEKLYVSLKRHEVRGRRKHENYIGLISLEVQRSVWFNRRIELWIQGAAEYFLR